MKRQKIEKLREVDWNMTILGCPKCGSTDIIEMTEFYACRECGRLIEWK